ncbi:Putative protein of unknown function [Podospora comata]|uniref:C2H2-type domain-containing protein n=1 Tax=Podospora comata TaxID=48703 RepID=A0ABY6SE44_PODCO|nr:Putative protein of unknown function [Podospora comata]
MNAGIAIAASPAAGHSIPDFECFTCDEYFNDNWDRSEHMWDYRHLPDEYYECEKCIEVFETQSGATRLEVERHHYCNVCDRTFDNLNRSTQRLASDLGLPAPGEQSFWEWHLQVQQLWQAQDACSVWILRVWR